MNGPALSPGTMWSMAKESVTAWIDDFAPSMGASIAYYTAFSIAPLLIIVIAIAGFVWGEEAASGYLYAQLGGILGDDGTKAVQAMVASAGDMKEGVVATVVGVLLLAVGATTVFAELQSDLDRIWKAPAVKKPEGLWGMLRSRVLSLGLVVSIGFLLLVSLVVSAALAALGSWWGGIFGDMEWLFHLLDIVVSIAVVTVMFALMYKILPRVKIAWHDVWIGAFVTALLFAIGKFLVGLYVGKTSVASSFGTAGSLAVLLVWVYYSAQIFLLGAEFTWVYAHKFGSRRDKDKPATAKDAAATTREPEDDRVSPHDRARRPGAAHTLPARGAPGLASRHTAALTAGAIVLGALAGRLLERTRRT
jgi:membrane protein